MVTKLFLLAATVFFIEASPAQNQQKHKLVARPDFTLSGDSVFMKGNRFGVYTHLDNNHQKIQDLNNQLLMFITLEGPSFRGGKTAYCINFPSTKQAVYLSLKGDQMRVLDLLNSYHVFKGKEIDPVAVTAMYGKQGMIVVNKIEFTDPLPERTQSKPSSDRNQQEGTYQYPKFAEAGMPVSK